MSEFFGSFNFLPNMTVNLCAIELMNLDIVDFSSRLIKEKLRKSITAIAKFLPDIDIRNGFRLQRMLRYLSMDLDCNVKIRRKNLLPNDRHRRSGTRCLHLGYTLRNTHKDLSKTGCKYLSPVDL